MNYEETLLYREQAGEYGIVPGLTTIKELLTRLNNPQQSLKLIHIAGTNGKGSVQAFLSEILLCAGYRIGCYTSPAVGGETEGIKINKAAIGKEDLAMYFTRVREESEAMERDGFAHPTLFEMETAAALCYFRENGCNAVILEAGMGGREDTTNVIEHPLLCIITSISMDHMLFLGNTLEEIVWQKAGIMKQDAAVVVDGGSHNASKLLENEAKRLRCHYTHSLPQQLTHLSYELKNEATTIFSYLSASRTEYERLEIHMAGVIQPENAILALEAAEQLSKKGFIITKEHIRQGLKNARWEYRFTIAAKRPLFILDGAHNKDAARRLAQAIRLYFKNKRVLYIMGVFRDKDYKGMIEETAALAEQMITITPPGTRGLPALELAEAVKRQINVTTADSIKEAIEMALLLADQDTVVIVFGSLSYLGEARVILEQKNDLKLIK